MKKVIIILLTLTMCLCLFSCGSNSESDVPDGMKLVETESNLYSLYVPEDWTVDMSTGTVSAYVSALDTSNITLTAFALDTATTLDDFWDSYADDFASTFGDSMKYLDDAGEESDKVVTQTTTFGGYEANKYVYVADVTGDTYQFMQITCIAEGYIYLFTYTALIDNYDTNLEDVQSVIDNFSFN